MGYCNTTAPFWPSWLELRRKKRSHCLLALCSCDCCIVCAAVLWYEVDNFAKFIIFHVYLIIYDTRLILTWFYRLNCLVLMLSLGCLKSFITRYTRCGITFQLSAPRFISVLDYFLISLWGNGHLLYEDTPITHVTDNAINNCTFGHFTN